MSLSASAPDVGWSQLYLPAAAPSYTIGFFSSFFSSPVSSVALTSSSAPAMAGGATLSTDRGRGLQNPK